MVLQFSDFEVLARDQPHLSDIEVKKQAISLRTLDTATMSQSPPQTNGVYHDSPKLNGIYNMPGALYHNIIR